MNMRWLAGVGALVMMAAWPVVGAAGPAVPSAVGDPASPDPTKGMVGEQPEHCLNLPGRPDLVVRATHLKNSNGSVRFVLYGDKPKEFLEKGKKLARVEIAAREGASVCISLPHPGHYALAILHDINGNGKFNLASDGGGFSNNPKVMFSRPSYEESAFAVDESGATLDIKMRYLSRGDR